MHSRSVLPTSVELHSVCGIAFVSQRVDLMVTIDVQWLSRKPGPVLILSPYELAGRCRGRTKWIAETTGPGTTRSGPSKSPDSQGELQNYRRFRLERYGEQLLTKLLGMERTQYAARSRTENKVGGKCRRCGCNEWVHLHVSLRVAPPEAGVSHLQLGSEAQTTVLPFFLMYL